MVSCGRAWPRWPPVYIGRLRAILESSPGTGRGCGDPALYTREARAWARRTRCDEPLRRAPVQALTLA